MHKYKCFFPETWKRWGFNLKFSEKLSFSLQGHLLIIGLEEEDENFK